MAALEVAEAIERGVVVTVFPDIEVFMIRLPETAIEAIREHGRESYRDEACGAMYGRVIGALVPLVPLVPLVKAATRKMSCALLRSKTRAKKNAIADSSSRPKRTGTPRPRPREASSRFGVLSFPSRPSAYPSAYDLEHAFPFFSYVILSVENAEPKTMRSFVLANDRKEFLEEKVEKE